MACLICSGAATAAQPLELAVKAAYIAKFAPFVAWPPSAFARATAPLAVCVQGDDPFGPLLDNLAAGHSVGGHPVIVRRMARLEPDTSCQIAYVAGSTAQSRAAALKAVEAVPVLTVTDADDDAGDAGIVRLELVGGRVRFMIDDARAARAGLTISSKLLALAAGVKR